MFSVTVKIEGIESRRRSAGLLHIVIGFFLIAHASIYYRLTEYTKFWPVALVLVGAGLSLFYGFFRRRFDPPAYYNYWMRLMQVITFTFLGVMLIGVGRWVDYAGVFVFAFLSIVLMFSERRIFQETTIFFDESGIKIPGYYRDHMLSWKELADVAVREDFITIFHVKQKYLQFQVMQDLSTLEVAKMNAFCREQIEEQSSIVNRES